MITNSVHYLERKTENVLILCLDYVTLIIINWKTKKIFYATGIQHTYYRNNQL